MKLTYNYASKRFTVGEHELHCGNVIELRLKNRDGTETWLETRIEHNANGWYFVHIKPQDPWEWTNFEARI